MNVERTCNLALKLLKDIDWDLEDYDFGLEDCDFKLEDSLDLDATGHDFRRPGIPNLTGERLYLLDICLFKVVVFCSSAFRWWIEESYGRLSGMWLVTNVLVVEHVMVLASSRCFSRALRQDLRQKASV